MFVNKEKIEDLTNKVKRLHTRTYEVETQIEKNKTNFVECETCGCLLKKENADPGEKVIKRRCRTTHLYTYNEDYVHQTYYCKTDSPKKEEKKVFIDNDKPVKIVLAAADSPPPNDFCHKECPKIINSKNPYMLPVENDLKEVTHLRCAACNVEVKL